MSIDIDVFRTVERAPLRTVHAKDLEQVLSHPRRTLARLVAHGALIRLANGVFTAPPHGYDGREWKPTLDVAGPALATARFGARNAVLMGIGAARRWTAIPRAIGSTTIAVQRRGRRPVSLHTGGILHFITRDIDRLDAILEPTELGNAPITTPAQTLFDLLMRPHQGNDPSAAREAVENLTARVDADEFAMILEYSNRTNAATRAIAEHLERHRAPS